MIIAIFLYLVFSLLASTGAGWIAYGEQGRVVRGVAVGFATLCAFAILAAGVALLLARVSMGG